MRVTFVVPVLESGGGARIVAGHARLLAERGHDVKIVAPIPEKLSLRQHLKIALGLESGPSDPKKSHTAQAGVPIIYVPRDKLSDPTSYPDADVIVATFWITAEWIKDLPLPKGEKVHFLQHYEAFPNIPAERVDAVWRLPTRKIAVAQWLVDLGRDRFGQDVALVPNAIDRVFYPKDRWFWDQIQWPTIGFLCSHAGFKDVGTSLAAIARVKEQMPDVRVIAFGTSKPDRDFPKYIEFHHLPKQEEIADIYHRSTVWLSTSITEGFNLPPLEAMLGGCPAVCSKTGRPLEIIENGVNGYLVDQGDVEGFAGAMMKVLSLDWDDWNRMSGAAYNAVKHPTWEESSRLFEEALQGVEVGVEVGSVLAG